MPRVKVLPHADLCPDGTTFEAKAGVSVLDNLLDQGIEVEHACEKSCACTTCHVIVREGCETWQGFLGAKPLTAEAFATLARA